MNMQSEMCAVIFIESIALIIYQLVRLYHFSPTNCKRHEQMHKLSKVCIYGHTYTTEHIQVTSFNVKNRERSNVKYLLADVGLCHVMMLVLPSLIRRQFVQHDQNLLFVFVATLNSVTSKFNILNSRGLEYYKRMHNELKKTNKNIVDRTNTGDEYQRFMPDS